MDDVEKPAGTEACASVTSAFLQILSVVHTAEANRVKNSRNVLQILSMNTRRTKVVELSTGTHRVADDVRRHCLADGRGGHYSTNLDRNRYGSDNNYLFTVTRYNLECLGLCPCFVDIEIIDTRNGNESQLVTAGGTACSCDSMERQELANTVNFTQFSNAQKVAVPASPPKEIRRISSANNLTGMRRASSAAALRRNPSSNRLYDGAANPTHSRNSGGSELFDALLMAATGEHDGAVVEGQGAGEAPVTSQVKNPKTTQQGNLYGVGSMNRLWGQHSLGNEGNDSMQNMVDALQKAHAEPESLTRLGSKGMTGMARRNSVSMIVENPVLAQTGGGESLMMGPYFPMMMGGPMDMEFQSGQEPREGAGDTDHGKGDGEDVAAVTADNEDGQVAAFKGLMRQFNNSAVNLNRLAASAGPVEVRKLREEIRQLREQNKATEAALEEARSAKLEALRIAEEAKESSTRAADIIQSLRALLASNDITDTTAVEDNQNLRTSEEQIKILSEEIKDLKSKLAEEISARKEAEGRAKISPMSAASPSQGQETNTSKGNKTISPNAAAAAMQMPLAAMGMLPLFNLPQLTSAMATTGPLNAVNGSSLNLFRPPLGNRAMPKVASMPSMGFHNALANVGLPPQMPSNKDASNKRKPEEAIDEEVKCDKNSNGKRAAVEDAYGKPEISGAVKEETHLYRYNKTEDGLKTGDGKANGFKSESFDALNRKSDFVKANSQTPGSNIHAGNLKEEAMA